MKKELTNIGRIATFWFGTFTMLFRATRSPVVMKTLKDRWYIVIKVLSVFEILRDYFVLYYILCRHHPYM